MKKVDNIRKKWKFYDFVNFLKVLQENFLYLCSKHSFLLMSVFFSNPSPNLYLNINNSSRTFFGFFSSGFLDFIRLRVKSLIRII